MRTSFLTFLGLSSVVTFYVTGCGYNDSDVGAPIGAPIPGGVGAPAPTNLPVGDGKGPAPQSPGGAGTLTAGDWDDNLNFDLFRDYIEEHLASSQTASFESKDRVVITVQSDDGAPVGSALVQIAGSEQSYLTAPTAPDGRVLFFPKHDGVSGDGAITITVNPPPGQETLQPVSVPLEKAATELTIKLHGATKALPSALDLAFVIDATGSMGDEIQYLQSEVIGIADSVKAKFGNLAVQYSLIVYRDQGDEYVTRTFDFTSDVNSFKAKLEDQSADGGGDFPEAMDQAMAKVPQLKWRTGNVARMAFLIADAPPHEVNISSTFKSMNTLRTQGIKLYPVAASGVDPEAEYVMRVGAEATLGRYLFLTDDSGVGDAHAKPHIPCYQVEKLNIMLGRMIASELTGTRVPAAPADILRAVGDPKDGTCKLFDGSEAHL